MEIYAMTVARFLIYGKPWVVSPKAIQDKVNFYAETGFTQEEELRFGVLFSLVASSGL